MGSHVGSHPQEGELVCVEMVATTDDETSAVFQGSVPHAALVQAFEHKKNSTSAWDMVMHRQADNRRKEFLKMRGPKGVGQAEMAVCPATESVGGNRHVLCCTKPIFLSSRCA